ncbi:unnamed protein product [Trichobilharzia regenti]|nr:unnamed protein product [Trichobilharzia regenti]
MCKVLLQDWQEPVPALTLPGGPLEVVDNFVYLGSCVSAVGGVTDEISNRIMKARVAYINLSHLWCRRDVSQAFKDPISESDASNRQIHQQSYHYRHHHHHPHEEQHLDKDSNAGDDYGGGGGGGDDEDDGEPPILPTSTSSSLKRWRESEDTASRSGGGTAAAAVGEMLNKQTDERSQDLLQTNPSSGISTGGVSISISRGKRPVDVNKLEADRKRLEEEAVKYKQLKAERRQQQQHRKQHQNQQQQHQQSSSGAPGSE